MKPLFSLPRRGLLLAAMCVLPSLAIGATPYGSSKYKRVQQDSPSSWEWKQMRRDVQSLQNSLRVDVQRLSQRLSSLEDRLSSLERRLDSVGARIDQLQQKTSDVAARQGSLESQVSQQAAAPIQSVRSTSPSRSYSSKEKRAMQAIGG